MKLRDRPLLSTRRRIKHFAQGRNLHGQVGLLNDSAGPSGFKQLGLGEDFARALKHRLEQQEGSVADGDRQTVAQESANLSVEGEGTE